MKDAERARKILRAIEWRLTELQLLPNGHVMSNEVFRAVLRDDEDMKMRHDILWKRKDCIRRFIWNNA